MHSKARMWEDDAGGLSGACAREEGLDGGRAQVLYGRSTAWAAWIASASPDSTLPMSSHFRIPDVTLLASPA